MIDSIIISPSGNFYGSEQVLFDYLKETKKHFQIYVPQFSIFEKKLIEERFELNEILGFKSIIFLYTHIFLKLLFTSIKSVYLNEAGHVRYIKVLAFFFPNVKFTIHIRLLEDTSINRIGSLQKNIHYISVSRFIYDKMPVPSCIVYDPYPFQDTIKKFTKHTQLFRVGIIGRITKSKGLDKLVDLLKILNSQLEFQDFKFYLFGDIINNPENLSLLNSIRNHPKIEFKGFVDNKDKMYNEIDAVLHLCETESLGRIYLESIDYKIPFIGFYNGGIGEIGELTGNIKFLVPFDKNWETILIEKLLFVKNGVEKYSFDFEEAKSKAKQIFGLPKYTETIDRIIK